MTLGVCHRSSGAPGRLLGALGVGLLSLGLGAAAAQPPAPLDPTPTVAPQGPVAPSATSGPAMTPPSAPSALRPPSPAIPSRLRVATFNTSLERATAGGLIEDLRAGSPQAAHVAAIIRAVDPDIVVLQEFDYDRAGEALRIFLQRDLERLPEAPTENDPEPTYKYRAVIPSNTGVPSGFDLDGDGKVEGPGDALGFGRHVGHYAFAVISKYPFGAQTRSFRTLLWRDLPGATLPTWPDGRPYYSEEMLKVLPLSSKNHFELPVEIPGGPAVHLLISHPTPPVFDGPEDRNGRRNFDELRLWKLYLDGRPLRADGGEMARLDARTPVVVIGDLNADPSDGDGVPGAVAQLLDHPRLHAGAARGALVPRSEGGAARGGKPGQKGDPSHHTAAWGLRADYVLPDARFQVLQTGVHWPKPGEPGAEHVEDPADPQAHPSSDHRLVWVDLAWPPALKASPPSPKGPQP